VTPSADEVTRANIAYHDDLAGSYDERAELFHPRVLGVYQEIFDREVWPRVGPKPRALDVGCGTGFLERFLVPRCSQVVAYDVSTGMLDRARAAYPTVDFRVGDAYALAPPDGPFDVVCGNALLHHLKDYERVLSRMADLVRPGGVLFLGYEPNELSFRVLAGVRKVYRRLLPEKRIEPLGDLERLAEYHQFFSDGISPRRLKNFLASRGMRARVFYRGEHFLGQLKDRLGWDLVSWVPQKLLGLGGPLTPNFHLVAWKPA
jgi:SAM-dependent methyltransferase